jgi:nitroimidazol reductase NimA-like FMN-containing flavoprotein (pyridoxamine 5'-phosphate oxidase superfamily)
MIEKMKALVKEKDVCVMATVSGGKPHCSLMAYVTDDDCSEIYMITHKHTKKYENLTENPSVSLLIDTREEHLGSRRPGAKALTVNGRYHRMDSEERKTLFRAKMLERHPHMRAFINHPDAELLSIKIASFLLLDGLEDAYFETI